MIVACLEWSTKGDCKILAKWNFNSHILGYLWFLYQAQTCPLYSKKHIHLKPQKILSLPSCKTNKTTQKQNKTKTKITELSILEHYKLEFKKQLGRDIYKHMQNPAEITIVILGHISLWKFWFVELGQVSHSIFQVQIQSTFQLLLLYDAFM